MTNGLPQRGDIIPEHSVAPISKARIAAYAEAALDSNPIHTDHQLAISVGLDGVPVQGMLIMGQFEAVINQWRPDAFIKHMDARFIRPLLVDQPIRITGRVVQCGDKEAMIRLTSSDGTGRLVCVGGARVVFLQD